MKRLSLAFFMLLLFVLPATAQNRAVSGTVTSDGASIPGVTVRVKSANLGTTTNAQGKFTLNVPNNLNTLIFSAVGYLTQEVAIPGSNTVNVVLVEDESSLGEVVISVGNRTATQRTMTDTSLPVDVISPSDLAATAQPSFDKALQYRVPSFNTVNTPVNDATSLLDPYEIRNMGPSRTLILINGKRKNSSSLIYIQTSPGRGESGADLASIPSDAIKRVEILRDGASAQYGSDAIAGVVNVILKDGNDAGSVNVNTGITHKGDGEFIGININNGAKVGNNGGFIHYAASLQHQALANRPGVVDAQGEANDFGANINDVKAFLAKFPDAGNVNGQPETAVAKFLLNGENPLSSGSVLYYNGAFVNKKVNSFANYRTPYWRDTDEGLLTPPGQPYVGYVPTFEGDLNDYNATVGFRSSTENGWKSDASFTLGNNKQLYTVANSRNRSMGKASPILFHPGGYEFGHKVGNIDISKAVNPTMSVAFGTEFRSESFTIYAGDLASYQGSPSLDSFPGLEPANAGNFTRYNIGGYADLGFDLSPQTFVNATARMEKYSDFGNAFVWKVSGRQKMDKMTIRASASTGFRAPSLHQINLQVSQASFVPGQGIQIKGLVNNRSAQAKLLGVPTLKAEKSFNFTFGLGLNPSKDLSVTLDYFNIALKDRIILGSEISAGTGAGAAALNKVLADNGIVALSFFTNALNTKTSGIDLVVSRRNLMLGAGKLGANFSANYMIENGLDGDITTPALIKQAGQSIFDSTQEALLFSSRPKYKGILSLDWTLDKVAINLNNTLFGPTTFRQNGLNSNLKTVFNPKVVTDLGANFKINEKTSVGVTIQNLLNVMPEWEFVALNSAGEAVLKDAAQVKNNWNAITFNGRYSNVTYDGSHFSQLGMVATAQLNIKL